MANSGSGGIRFSDEQLFILEEVFEECSDPSADQIRVIKLTFPVLGTLEDSQLEIWFHNRRTFKRLVTTNTRLMAENYVLKNMVDEMESQNELMRQLVDVLNEELPRMHTENSQGVVLNYHEMVLNAGSYKSGPGNNYGAIYYELRRFAVLLSKGEAKSDKRKKDIELIGNHSQVA